MSRISVVMASYLGSYPNCASNRSQKFKRAIHSFVQQTHQNKELIVVSDGCEETIRLYNELQEVYEKHPSGKNWKLLTFSREEEKCFDGKIRNAGMHAATGDIICYLDTDDFFQDHHLQKINEQFYPQQDWVYYNDLVPEERNLSKFRERDNILSQGRIGTSAIAHRHPDNSYIDALWTSGYGHDWLFVQALMKNGNYSKIKTPGYMVCHIPGQIDY